MAITTTTQVTDLRTIFNSMKEVKYRSKELKSSDFASALTMDMELPVLEEGVTFNTGEAEVTEVKLTTGAIWTSKAMKGEADIQFQVASIDGKINEMMMNKVTSAAITSTEGVILEGETFEGSGYSLAPKKITGALLLMSEDRQTILALPNVEMYSSLVIENGKPVYYNVKVKPLENSEGVDIMILWKKKS